MIDRRRFIAQIAAITASGAALQACRSAASTGSTPRVAWKDAIGLQLYTVRDLLQQDFEGTLEQVAQIGYKRVEFAGLYNRTPAQVRTILDRLGLSAPSTHVGVNLLRQSLPAQIETAKTLGHEYLTAPSYPLPRNGTTADWQRVAEEFNRWGTACRDAGLKFAFHNHSAEFQLVEGKPGMEILLAASDPALVDYELDIYWARHAGFEANDLFERHPGRFTMWHVKDMRDPTGSKAMVPVGGGSIDFASIFQRASRSGLKHFFVEHDNAAQTGGSLASIRASFQHLRTILA
jgi:sugar phosphate isomerase/epimerase